MIFQLDGKAEDTRKRVWKSWDGDQPATYFLLVSKYKSIYKQSVRCHCQKPPFLQLLAYRGTKEQYSIGKAAPYKGKTESTFLDPGVDYRRASGCTMPWISLPPLLFLPSLPSQASHATALSSCSTAEPGRTHPCRERVKEDNKTQQVQAHEKEIKQNSLLMGAIEMIESVDSVICRNWGDTVESN